MIIISCCFQGEHAEPLPRLGELGIQGDPKGDGPDQDDNNLGCSSMREHSLHSPVQIRDQGCQPQSADGGQFHRQVGAEVSTPCSARTWERRLLLDVCVIFYHGLVF